MRPVIAVHGGAGNIREHVRPRRGEVIEQALAAGWQVLQQGGRALDAVVAAVRVLEDAPEFNAGRGSSLTRVGTIEMDAGIMEGTSLNVGAVAGVQRVANPIVLAARVLEASPHILLIQEGAERFAQEQGIPLVDPETLITEERRQRLQKVLARLAEQEAGDTVGAVALDVNGHMAAATSTGGLMGKIPGRVGDSPLIGCGFYADDRLGACSTTGIGEHIARALLAYRSVAGLANADVEEAARQALAFMETHVGREAGILLLSRDGRVTAVWDTMHMSYGYQTETTRHIVG